MSRSASDIVRSEIGHCVSYLVNTLAMAGHGHDYLGELIDQAFELAAPIPDYEEAATEDGWSAGANGDFHHSEHGHVLYEDWEALCREFDIEPYDREVFEHWIVSDWLADKLAENGEKVDKDFAGLTVWARTTTGQLIEMDGVIEKIASDLAAQYPD